MLVAGDDLPHLFTPFPEGAPPDLPADRVHPPLFLELDAGVESFVVRLHDLLGAALPEKLAVDEYSAAMFFGLRSRLGEGTALVDAGSLIGAAKICKTADELECIRRAQRINELAMYDCQGALRPGVRQSDLSAIFFGRIFDLGASANMIDPIWQVMPPSRAAGPYTTNGDVAFPLVTTDRILRDGDVVWVDSGLAYEGYASDFGRTWIVGDPPRPTDRQRSQFQRWRAVVDAVLAILGPGVTGADLAAAARTANGGATPWLDHFYLAHGVGIESAEMPLIGTDLGPEFDQSLVMAPGMVLVLEPVIWDDGECGYRSEDIVAVTEDGYVQLNDYPYSPYD
jgi:Xaa-Pro dipeptidase